MPKKMEVTQEFDVYNLNEVNQLPSENSKKIAVGNLKEIIDDNTPISEKLNKLVRMKFTADGHIFDLNTFKGISNVKDMDDFREKAMLSDKIESESLYKEQQAPESPQGHQATHPNNWYSAVRSIGDQNFA